jgi:hypothetical protein
LPARRSCSIVQCHCAQSPHGRCADQSDRQSNYTASLFDVYTRGYRLKGVLGNNHLLSRQSERSCSSAKIASSVPGWRFGKRIAALNCTAEKGTENRATVITSTRSCYPPMPGETFPKRSP